MSRFTAEEDLTEPENPAAQEINYVMRQLKLHLYPENDAGTPIYDQLKAEQAAQERADAIKESFRADLANQKLHYGTFI